MTNKVEQSAGYYAMLADKHNSSGRGPNQARIYGELAALVRECSSYEEIQARMKAGGYYESPAQALILDELVAHRDAATELGFTRLAQIYSDRHDAVAADYGAAWTTAWAEDVKAELNRIGLVVDAFNTLMSAYLEYRCAAEVTRAEPAAKMRAALQTMKAHGESFQAVATSPYYRRHSPLSDDEFKVALRTIHGALTAPADESAAMAAVQARAKAVIEAGNEQLLQQKQQRYERRQRRSINLCVAPDDAPGEYTYEPFFEGRL